MASSLSPAAAESGPGSPSTCPVIHINIQIAFLNYFPEVLFFSHCLPSLVCIAKTASIHTLLLLRSAVHPMQSGFFGKQIFLLALSVACWAYQEDGKLVSSVRSSTTSPGNTWPHGTLALPPLLCSSTLQCSRTFMSLDIMFFVPTKATLETSYPFVLEDSIQAHILRKLCSPLLINPG